MVGPFKNTQRQALVRRLPSLDFFACCSLTVSPCESIPPCADDDMMTWWHDDMMTWWPDDLTTWSPDDMITWSHDHMIPWRHDDLTTCQHDDMTTRRHDNMTYSNSSSHRGGHTHSHIQVHKVEDTLTHALTRTLTHALTHTLVYTLTHTLTHMEEHGVMVKHSHSLTRSHADTPCARIVGIHWNEMLQFESAVRSAEPFCTYSPHIVEIAILRQKSRVSWWHDRIALQSTSPKCPKHLPHARSTYVCEQVNIWARVCVCH